MPLPIVTVFLHWNYRNRLLPLVSTSFSHMGRLNSPHFSRNSKKKHVFLHPLLDSWSKFENSSIKSWTPFFDFEMCCVVGWEIWACWVNPFVGFLCCGQNWVFSAMAGKKLGDTLGRELAEEVKKWGCMKQTGVSLRQMMNFGGQFSSRNLLISAKFVHKELPIRIARRVLELEDLPYGLSSKHAVLKVSHFSLFSFPYLSWFAWKGPQIPFVELHRLCCCCCCFWFAQKGAFTPFVELHYVCCCWFAQGVRKMNWSMKNHL